MNAQMVYCQDVVGLKHWTILREDIFNLDKSVGAAHKAGVHTDKTEYIKKTIDAVGPSTRIMHVSMDRQGDMYIVSQG